MKEEITDELRELRANIEKDRDEDRLELRILQRKHTELKDDLAKTKGDKEKLKTELTFVTETVKVLKVQIDLKQAEYDQVMVLFLKIFCINANPKERKESKIITVENCRQSLSMRDNIKCHVSHVPSTSLFGILVVGFGFKKDNISSLIGILIVSLSRFLIKILFAPVLVHSHLSKERGSKKIVISH